MVTVPTSSLSKLVLAKNSPGWVFSARWLLSTWLLHASFQVGVLLWAGPSQVAHHKEFSCNAGDAGDMGWIPGLGRSPGRDNGNLLQYSCLDNPMGRGAWQVIVDRVAKNQTWVKWPRALLWAHDSKFCTLQANSKAILFHHFLDMVRPTDQKKITVERIVCFNHRSQEQEAGNTTGRTQGSQSEGRGGRGHCGRNFCCGFCGKE